MRYRSRRWVDALQCAIQSFFQLNGTYYSGIALIACSVRVLYKECQFVVVPDLAFFHILTIAYAPEVAIYRSGMGNLVL